MIEEKIKKYLKNIEEFEDEEVFDSELFEELSNILEDTEPHLDDERLVITKKYKDFNLFTEIDISSCKINNIIKPDVIFVEYKNKTLIVYPN